MCQTWGNHMSPYLQCLALSRWSVIVNLLFLPRASQLCCKVGRGQQRFPLWVSWGCVLTKPVKQDDDVLKTGISQFQDFCHPEQLLVGVERIKRGLEPSFQRHLSTVAHKCFLVYQFTKTQVCDSRRGCLYSILGYLCASGRIWFEICIWAI